MSLVTLSGIAKAFGQRAVLEQVSLSIYPNERIGLVGANGAGKTTLLRIICGQVEADSGTVAVARGVRVGYLPQEPQFDSAALVIDEAEAAFASLHELAARLRRLEHDMAGRDGAELHRVLREYQQTQHEFDLAGGYAWRHRVEATLLGVGLPAATWRLPVEALSGGQKSRLALARLLMSDPDVLLLDEPTNHLDLDGIEWLQEYLCQFRGAVLLTSHDRYLLDRLVGRIIWLRDGALASFPGNYSAFIRQRQVIELTRQRQYEAQQRDIEKQREFIRRLHAASRAREARGRGTRLERLLRSDQLVKPVGRDKSVHIVLRVDERAGDLVLGVRGLSKAWGQNVLWRDLGFTLERGDRLGVIGPNGSGKTTLLRVLLGEEQPDAGEIRWGTNLRIAYYAQDADDLDPARTVLQTVRAGRESRHSEQELRDALAAMLFRGDDVHKPVEALSGGERSRLRLCEMLLDRPNVLLLDEPTNHLDIASREALETALAAYEGTLLCVSHDRYFLDRVCRRLLVLRPPQARLFAGTYSQWVATARAESDAARASPPPQKSAAPQVRPRPAPRKDNPYLRPFGLLTVEQLEHEISETEKAIAECVAALADPQTFRDAARAREVQQRYQELTARLTQLEQEYFGRSQ